MIVKNRIKKYSEFQKVIEDGELKVTGFFKSYTLENQLGYSRFGISVPKKSGDAVTRNKIKRQIRACIAQSTDYSLAKDFVFIVRKNYQIDDFNKIKSEIQQLIK